MITALRRDPDTLYAIGLIVFGLIWVNPLISAGVLVATLVLFPKAHPIVRVGAVVLLVLTLVWIAAFAIGAVR